MGQTSQIIHENQCPDCLYLDLESKLRTLIPGAYAREVVLFLTINFNEEWAELPGGRVKFGVKSGELRLDLTQGTIPYQDRNLAGRLALEVNKERHSQTNASSHDESQLSLSTSSKTELEAQAKVSSAHKKDLSYSQGDKFNVTSCQVTTKGNVDSPAWVFEVQTKDPVLKGLLSEEKLATMQVSGSKWQVKATFKVNTLKDIVLTETDGPFLRNASPEKRTVLEIGIAKLLLKHKFKPFLSQTVLSHE